MKRDVSPELLAAILAPQSNMVYLCQINHPAGIVRLNSGVKPVTYQGETYVALGKMGSFQGVAQSMDAKSQEVTLALAAPFVDETAQQVLSMPVKGNQAFLWRAYLDDDWSVIGRIQEADVTMDSVEVTIDESGMHVLVIKGYMTQFAARRVATRYYSNETLQAEFPGDTGFDRMASLADKIV